MSFPKQKRQIEQFQEQVGEKVTLFHQPAKVTITTGTAYGNPPQGGKFTAS
jgi:hypothetical protein